MLLKVAPTPKRRSPKLPDWNTAGSALVASFTLITRCWSRSTVIAVPLVVTFRWCVLPPTIVLTGYAMKLVQLLFSRPTTTECVPVSKPM